jgi:hypothetical protein
VEEILARTNRGGHQCPSWCTTDHDELPRPPGGFRRAATDSATAPAATVSHLTQQVRAAERADGGPRSPGLQPVSASLAEGGPDSSVEALDGSERKLLLAHLARAYPEVVEAGFDLVAEWRAECAERRRAASSRKSKERRRRQRAEARDRG